MCSVNDKIRRDYDNKIVDLKKEYENENNKLLDLEQAKDELQQLVDAAQCAINNLSECDFGGDKILSSVTTSQQGYQERMDYYDEYMIKCRNAMDEISDEIEKVTSLRNNLSINCGSCSECITYFNNF